MGVSLESMVAYVRDTSGLKGNPIISDDRIASYLIDGKSKLRDIFIESFAHWFLKTYDFTLAGGVGGNVLDLTLIPDLQMDQYLNRNPDSATPEPVVRLGSLAERAQFNGISPTWSGSGILTGNRRYDTDGDVLTVYPIGLSSGTYRLFYTPMDVPFAFKKTVNFTIASGDTPSVPPPGLLPGTGAWLLANGNLAGATDIPSDGGFDLVLTFTSTNLGFSSTYHVVAVGLPPDFGSPTFSTSNLTSTAGYTNPATGSGTYTYQPLNTRDDLPQVLTPWELYVKTWACIEVRKSRNQPVNPDWWTTINNEEKRARMMAKTRTEGVRQAPMIHSRTRRRGWSYNTP